MPDPRGSRRGGRPSGAASTPWMRNLSTHRTQGARELNRCEEIHTRVTTHSPPRTRWLFAAMLLQLIGSYWQFRAYYENRTK